MDLLSISFVIPCYNEASRIHYLKNGLNTILENNDIDAEIILVNDGSSDNLLELIKENYPKEISSQKIQFINLQQNEGKGAALKKGVEIAQKEFVLTLDADMATPALQFLDWYKMNSVFFNGNTILIGSRVHEESEVEDNFLRKIAGHTFNFLVKLFTGLNIKDTQCGYKLYPKSTAKTIFSELKEIGWAHDVELLLRAKKLNKNIVSLPVQWNAIEESKISLFSDSIKMLRQIIRIKV